MSSRAGLQAVLTVDVKGAFGAKVKQRQVGALSLLGFQASVSL
ncbi:MAG: hypothetical protein ACLP9Y_32140 [Mycobacterium sp.]